MARGPEPTGLEAELKAAISLYRDQLEQLRLAVVEDPDNMEIVEISEQLQEALADAQTALRAAFTAGADSAAGGYATSASAAAGMDEDELAVEAGQEAESSAPPDEQDPRRATVEAGPEAQSRGRSTRNNARMHPANKYYKEEPDFAALARQYPELRPYVTQGPDGRAHYEYTSWEATRQLTATLLKHDFEIDWWLPEGQLVPTLTNRANYIHWLHDLLALSRPEGAVAIRGLDIGCGANMIYPLLGAAVYGWHMVGADVTDVALQWARRNVRSNPHLGHLLEVRDSRKRRLSFSSAAGDAREDEEGAQGEEGAHEDGETHRVRRQKSFGQEGAEGLEGAEVGWREQEAAESVAECRISERLGSRDGAAGVQEESEGALLLGRSSSPGATRPLAAVSGATASAAIEVAPQKRRLEGDWQGGSPVPVGPAGVVAGVGPAAGPGGPEVGPGPGSMGNGAVGATPGTSFISSLVLGGGVRGMGVSMAVCDPAHEEGERLGFRAEAELAGRQPSTGVDGEGVICVLGEGAVAEGSDGREARMLGAVEGSSASLSALPGIPFDPQELPCVQPAVSAAVGAAGPGPTHGPGTVIGPAGLGAVLGPGTGVSLPLPLMPAGAAAAGSAGEDLADAGAAGTAAPLTCVGAGGGAEEQLGRLSGPGTLDPVLGTSPRLAGGLGVLPMSRAAVRGVVGHMPIAAAAGVAAAAAGTLGRHGVGDYRVGHDAEEADAVGGILTAAVRGPTERFAFSMCNPPFFGSMAEACTNPNTACGGTEAEMVYPGGELAFIMRMVEDSVRLGARIHWYTTMVGKKSTLKALRRELHVRHVTAIRTTEFAQGKTSRWAIAWSFEVDRNLANTPLPRAVNPALMPPVKPKRLMSFTLQGPQQDGRKLLKAMESALAAHGASNVAVDLGMWTLTALLPSPAALFGGVGAGAGVAAAAGGSPVEQQQHAQKRQRHPIAATGAAADGAGTTMRVNLYQQQRGRFDVMASIPKAASDADALAFSSIMQKTQDDLVAMWT